MFLGRPIRLNSLDIVYSSLKGWKSKMVANFGQEIIHFNKSTDMPLLMVVKPAKPNCLTLVYVFTTNQKVNRDHLEIHVFLSKIFEKSRICISIKQFLIVVKLLLDILFEGDKCWWISGK